MPSLSITLQINHYAIMSHKLGTCRHCQASARIPLHLYPLHLAILVCPHQDCTKGSIARFGHTARFEPTRRLDKPLPLLPSSLRIHVPLCTTPFEVQSGSLEPIQ